MMTLVFGVKLTEKNIDEIIAYGAEFNLNLEDFRDDLSYNAEDGEDTYVIASVNMNTEELMAITTKPKSDFFASWKFDYRQHPYRELYKLEQV